MPHFRFTSPLNGLLHAYGSDFTRLQRLVDPLLVALLFRCLVVPETHLSSPSSALVSVLLVAVVAALLLPQGRLYQSYRQSSLFILFRRLSVSWSLVLSALLTIAYILKISSNYSRVAVIAWALSSWSILLLLHLGGRKSLRWHRQRGGNTRLVVYWGTEDAARSFFLRLQSCPYLGLRLSAWFTDGPAMPDSLPTGMPVCGGGLDDLRTWLEHQAVDQLVFSDSSSCSIPTPDLIHFFGDLCIPVSFAPHWANAGMRFDLERIGEQPCLDLWRPHKSALDRHIKRLVDIIVAALILFLLSPFLLMLGLAVRLSSSGPALFWQARHGLDGRSFNIVKFRTMYVQQPGFLPRLEQAFRNDPRVTPLGRFLRRWSLDELPQFWNVLIGDMSLVGPRPHAVEHNEQYRRLIPGYMQRHLFKPGITGLAQVQGFRGETATLEAMQRRVAADLDYQRDWTLAGDFKILLQTLLQLRSNNAY